MADWFIFKDDIWVQVPERSECEIKIANVCSASFCTKCKYKYTFGVYKSDQLQKLLVLAANNSFCIA